MIDPTLAPLASQLVASAGLGVLVDIQRIVGGGNNRVFRVDADRGAAVLKVYFRGPNDSRDRLGAETRFLRYAEQFGLRCVPRLLAMDDAAGASLLELVPGRKPLPGDIDTSAVDQAIDFFVDLNRHRDTPNARALPDASEACSRVVDHVHLVERRIDRLQELPDGPAREFVNRRLVPRWQAWVAQHPRHADEAPLPLSERCISPSDFGFHNAIRSDAGRWVFIDFEYAGWDDPAKTLADFFCQPAVPVPRAFWQACADRFRTCVNDGDAFRTRASLLDELYRFKWCCILLNAFHPHDGQRRRFAQPLTDDELHGRLLRAQDLLESLAGL